MADEDKNKLYCVCQKPYSANEFMIECDKCNEWYHGTCVQIQESHCQDIECYHCPKCEKKHGPLILKNKFDWTEVAEPKPSSTNKVKTGTTPFIKELKRRFFLDAREILPIFENGFDLTVEYLEKNGFNFPILVEKPVGLGLHVPNQNFTVNDVEKCVGSMREIDVIDVALQEDVKMYMRQWTDYFNCRKKKRTLNVISLEFSHTPLEKLVSPPDLVRQLSWVTNYWPEQVPEDKDFVKPEVQRYCLMGVRDSYTDFHVDFGGTSVWYHIIKGEKVFYFIKPTAVNLSLYERWVSSAHQGEMFFGDQVEKCYRISVEPGNTLFIPTGWIHAVLTPKDSLVFGGNFLHNFNIELQIQAYEMEQRANTPEKYLFPNYEVLHWYAAKNILDTIKEYFEDRLDPPNYLMEGGRALAVALKSWTQKQDLNKCSVYISKKNTVPQSIPYAKILKDLYKLTRHIHLGRLKEKSPDVEKHKKKKSSSKKDEKHKSEKRKRKKEKEKEKSNKKKKLSSSDNDKVTLDNLPWPSAFSLFESSDGNKNKESLNEKHNDKEKISSEKKAKNRLKLKLSMQPSASSPTSLGSNLANIFATNNLTQGYTTAYSNETTSTSHSDMKDAIQGMLTMSKGKLPEKSTNIVTSPVQYESKITIKKPSPKPTEFVPVDKDIFNDDTYVYPSLDISDNEKKLARLKEEKDDNWNPHSKVQSIKSVKEERPQRPNAKREAVEQGLAAAASKVTSPIKRQYNTHSKKKRKSKSPTRSASESLNVAELQSSKVNDKKESEKKLKKSKLSTKDRLRKILKINRPYKF